MNLAAPLGLLAAGLTVPLVVWYVLRSRRPRVTVASTFLWNRSERSVQAAVPWQRFRPDVTFWLVLLALLIGALALARPFLRVEAELGDHTILVVDASASMLADEDGPTRLELARREAEELVGKLGPGQEVSVVEAGTRARVLLSAGGDPGTIRSALRKVRPTHGPADLVDAFTLAAALERPGQSTVVHLLTDGAVPDTAAAALPVGTVVTAVGSDRPNLAVSQLQAVPLGAGASQVFVQVRNFGVLPTTGRLTLSVDGEDVVEEELRFGPRATVDRVLSVAGGDGEVLVARVEASGTDVRTGEEQGDALSVDDAAYAVLSAPREVAVLLATPGNVFLEAALAAVPGVTVDVQPNVPQDLADVEQPRSGPRSQVDLLVVDRVSAPLAPTVPTMYVAPTRLPAGVTGAGEVELPTLTFQDAGHELLADVELAGVQVAAATPVTAPALTPIVSGPDAALVLAGRLDGTPVVLVTFDLLRSNLPLQAAWPVFVANSVSWLAGPPVTAPSTAGATVTLPAPPGTTAVVASPPGGGPVRLDPADPRLTVDQVGVWRLDYEGEPASAAATTLAVNAAAEEGDLARERPDPVEARADAAERTAGAAEGRQSLVRELLAVVLALAALEWIWAYALRPALRRRRQRRRGSRGASGGTPATAPAGAGGGRR
ncbi:MAG: VWA domain-containing protein [Actinobacteria bacterium]|nr:VWA domain-containing protein [Actinomycetota bacterium]